MKSVIITAKVKLYPTSEQMIILNKTLSVIWAVLNFVSAFVFGQAEMNGEADHVHLLVECSPQNYIPDMLKL